VHEKDAPIRDRRSATWLRAAWTTLFAIAGLIACHPESSAPPRAYDVPLRSDAELSKELEALCDSRDADAPVLVEFSAAWCSDCQRLGVMKQAPALADELAAWPHITVNVARFDRHRDLLDGLGIESIAHWAVLDPSDCTTPITRWKRIADRTLEVSSGEARNLSPADLADWLRGFRTG
jgi:thiol-disulfide isomerase/thioredoxin